MGRIPQESVGGVLISLSRPWARKWIDHWSLWCIASATPLDRYQIILLGDRGTCLWTTCPRLLPESGRPGVELATFCVASQQPNHYTTRPHFATSSRWSWERMQLKASLLKQRLYHLLICELRHYANFAVDWKWLYVVLSCCWVICWIQNTSVY